VIKAVVTIAGSADLAPGHVVVVKSTVSPGTISGPVRAAVELGAAAKGTAGPAVVYAPEFHAIGSIVHDIAHPYLLVVGGDEHWAIDRAIELEQSLVDAPVEVARLDPTAAEIVKLASNCFRTTKIAFANSLAQLCAAYGTDAAAVCDAVGADPYIGRRYLAPGLPFGGPCYPRDNPALAAAGTAVGVEVPLAAAVAHANELRYEELLSAALTAGPGAIGIVGVSFKDGVSELEGSPSLELARRLEQAGREVLIHDPRHASVDGRPTVTLEELVRVCSAVFVGAADAVLARAVGDELARHGAGPLVLDPCGLVTRSAANDVRAPWVPADAVPE
jgi:UDPglucose 6-dehydrogenase